MTPQDPQAFERLLANCADEPIRFPGAIQPHGLLVTLTEPGLQIQQVSANVLTLFGVSAESLLGLPLAALSGSEAANAVQQAAVYTTLADAPPLALNLLGREYEGLLHRDQGILVLELELKPDDSEIHSTMGKVRNLSRMLQRLQGAKTLTALYEICVREIQALTGYDRVLIYRFQDEGHGQVIAEASSPAMELFNGMFFPASDIPEQARELYRTHWLRIIPNADYQPVPLIPTLRPDTGKIFTEVARSTSEDIEKAIDSTRDAYDLSGVQYVNYGSDSTENATTPSLSGPSRSALRRASSAVLQPTCWSAFSALPRPAT